MKTLKQLLQEIQELENEENLELSVQDALNIVKEWLTQKRQEFDARQETYGNTKAISHLIIGELLGELKKETEK